jgi:hypothetical protein
VSSKESEECKASVSHHVLVTGRCGSSIMSPSVGCGDPVRIPVHVPGTHVLTLRCLAAPHLYRSPHKALTYPGGVVGWVYSRSGLGMVSAGTCTGILTGVLTTFRKTI